MTAIAMSLKNEKGFVLGITVILLAIFTLLGVSAIVLATIELEVAANEQFYKIAFYGAEAARGYVPKNTDLYDGDNITEGEGLNFPDNDDTSEKTVLGPIQSFNGEVVYIGASAPPRGSGFEVGTFRAHRYRMTCNGFGPRDTQSQIEAGFYRIGF